MIRLVRAVVLAAAATIAPPSNACGICVEDKMAATYDHAMIERATSRGRWVVFAGLDGPGTPADLAKAAGAAARGLRGVDPAGIRTAAAPAAIAFVLDPKVLRTDDAIAAIERRAGTAAIRLTVINVLR